MHINKNNFYKLFLLIIVFSFPIIINNNFYIDDNVRLITGSPDWSWVGRPFADYLYYFLSGNKLIDDFFPISLILGILFFCLIVSNIIKEDKSWLGILPYSFFIVNPFFLQNLNYRFDSLPMLIAVSMGIYAFFYESNKKYKEWIFPICSLVLCLGFYQPCVNIFLMLIACNILTRLKTESKMYVTFK